MQFSRRRYAPAGKEAKSCRQWFGRHVFARVCGAVLSVSHCPDAAPQCLLAKAPKGTKNAFVPRRQAKTPAVFFDGAELAGGVVWFSSCRQGVGKPLFTLTPAAVCACRYRARELPLKSSRGVEIAAGQFRLPREKREESNFCVLLFAYKRTWLPGKRQKAAVNGSADKLLLKYAAQCFQYPIARMPRRSAFWPKPQKAPKTLLFPGAKRKHLRYFSTAPN